LSGSLSLASPFGKCTKGAARKPRRSTPRPANDGLGAISMPLRLLSCKAMPKRRADADHRRFLDEFLCVKIPRLRATGVVQLDAVSAVIPFGDSRKLIGLAHTKFRNGGSWSYFRCPQCARRANRLWLVEDRPLCAKCCNGAAPSGATGGGNA
jgi:hypothetical protein